ncbi:DUF6671 family protein [Alkaliphilus hydrothermalis]|uniref:Ribosomal protein S27AE n=1 Tax=Alkaliphilus hydrothermalis TaxID=1482730 RepID=A0ABS2NS49_9FIRM|nr:DUF6671 family protein [Alkaliphilus hydrothermalis]MBM7615775.1 ribosomal protein S27AE [Alkaliphilus hydrothermalis]
MDQHQLIHLFFKGRTGVLATMHKKEEVIAPILEKDLGIKITIPKDFNTDVFGTFTKDIDRRGNQLEAAKYKAEAAMALEDKTIGIASEGAFGPHPISPFLPFNREIVLLIDKTTGLEIYGISATIETNYMHKMVKSFQEAIEFAKEAGFPQHGIVIKVKESSTDPKEIIKGIITEADLEKAVEFALAMSSNEKIYIETDMRALYNPTRMKSIEAATRDLVTKLYNLCPQCSWPGFQVVDSKKGLPCSWCGLPTELILSHRYLCTKCGYSEEKPYPNGIEKADPGRCGYCNP